MNIPGTQGDIHTKYEVSMYNPVARRGVYKWQWCQHQQWHTTDKAWLYKALWLKKQMSQKTTILTIKVQWKVAQTGYFATICKLINWAYNCTEFKHKCYNGHKIWNVWSCKSGKILAAITVIEVV